MNNKEIELKFIIDVEKRKLIEADIAKLAKFESEKRQVDTYYIPNFKSFEKNGETMECVRIRESGGKAVLCYKRIHREAAPVYCDEYELEISSKEEMEKILFALGFTVQMIIDKTRKIYSYANFEFDFDSVNGNLELLEIELKDNNSSVGTILDFVKKYGLSKSDVTYRGIQLLVKDLEAK